MCLPQLTVQISYLQDQRKFVRQTVSVHFWVTWSVNALPVEMRWFEGEGGEFKTCVSKSTDLH